MQDYTVGYINSINTAGTVDGPGVRMVVFMQGCPLRCIYCHNPDTWKGDSASIELTPVQLLERFNKNRLFYKNGGITFSGGEPLVQSKFIYEAVALFKENNIHTAVDTSGVILDEYSKILLSIVDLVLLDVKFCNDYAYKKYTGVSIDPLMRFIDYIYKNCPELEVIARQVIVSGYNDNPSDVTDSYRLVKHLPQLRRFELLPFLKLCLEKYESLSLPFPLKDTPQTTTKQINELSQYLL